MPTPGRSVDDLPLAAYSTGVDPATEPEMDPAPAVVATTPAGPTPASPPTSEAPAPGPFAPAAPIAPPIEPRGASPQPAFRDLLRDPRAHARDPRLLLSGVVAIGVVLLVGSLLLGGGATGNATALASPSAPARPVITTAPAGDANVAFTGAVTGTFDLMGLTGTGRAGGSTMDSSWGDQAGDAMILGGPVSDGTRMTDDGFVLSWTVMVNGKAVTFTSKAGECVIGMAIKPTTVSGSFTCHKVKSADGKLVVGATGTYRT